MSNEPFVRTTKEIKAALLRRAREGQSRHTPAEVIGMIQAACTRAKTIPAEHEKILREIDDSQPRSVMMLNALAAKLGLMERYTDTTSRNFIEPNNFTLQ